MSFKIPSFRNQVVTLPELKSQYGVTVSRQRLHTLQQTMRFPIAYRQPGGVGYFDKAEIEAWLDQWRERMKWVKPNEGVE
jgi:hypothetical protein